jgi:hypothetical protein
MANFHLESKPHAPPPSQPPDDALSVEQELPTEPMTINLGPSHPATHGTVRIVAELDGEIIRKADVEVGYLHRGFEKSGENATWTQVMPYTDRLNYVSPLLNNVAPSRDHDRWFTQPPWPSSSASHDKCAGSAACAPSARAPRAPRNSRCATNAGSMARRPEGSAHWGERRLPPRAPCTVITAADVAQAAPFQRAPRSLRC